MGTGKCLLKLNPEKFIFEASELGHYKLTELYMHKWRMEFTLRRKLLEEFFEK